MPICESDPASEEYADFIVQYASWDPGHLKERAGTECIHFISANYAVIHVRLDRIAPMSIYRYSYNAIPKLYGLLDITALESSGIPEAVNHPNLQANGKVSSSESSIPALTIPIRSSEIRTERPAS